MCEPHVRSSVLQSKRHVEHTPGRASGCIGDLFVRNSRVDCRQVNGARLPPTEAKELLHQDFVVLSKTFRPVHPKHELGICQATVGML